MDWALDKIPSFEEIGTPGTDYAYSLKDYNAETLPHLTKHKRMRTGWISTTSSLLRALQILFIEHGKGGQLFVI